MYKHRRDRSEALLHCAVTYEHLNSALWKMTSVYYTPQTMTTTREGGDSECHRSRNKKRDAAKAEKDERKENVEARENE